MEEWLLPFVEETIPDADPATRKSLCSLRWCFLATNGRLRRRHSIAPELFAKSMGDLARKLVRSEPSDDGMTDDDRDE